MSEISNEIPAIDADEQVSQSDEKTNDIPLAPLSSFDRTDNLSEERSNKPKMKFSHFFAQILFSQLGSILLVVFYVILGGFLFYFIESRYEPQQQQQIKTKHLHGIQHIRNVITDEFNRILNQSFELHYAHWRGMLSRTDEREKANWQIAFPIDRFHQLIHYELARMQAEEEVYFDKDDQRTNTAFHPKWTYSIAMLYSATIISTVGYGNITPKSMFGKLSTCLYAIVGIPIMIMYVTNTGDLLAFLFIKYYFMMKEYFQRKNKQSIQTEQHRVPVPIVASLLIVYIVSGGILFSNWEGWSFIDSMYFSFITFTTIGLGDFVPGQGTLTENKNGKSILCAIYLLNGLVLTTMCFKLIQDDFYLMKRKVLTCLGFHNYQHRYLVYHHREQGVYT